MATASIANLVVTLGANSAQLVSELERTRRETHDWSGYMKSATGIVAGSFAAAATAAAGYAAVVGYMVDTNAATIDSLGKTADKLGLTTEALQTLRYTAEMSGVGIQTTDVALQRMVRRIAEAAAGSGEAVGALKALNLDARELAQLSPDKQFRAIADAMKLVSSQGDRVRLTMKLFDSDGVALVNTLISDLDAAEAKYKSLGGTITRQQAAITEAYNDAKTNVQYLFTAFAQKMTVYLAAPFTEVFKYIDEFVEKAGGIDQVAKRVAISIMDLVEGILKAVSSLAATINDLKVTCDDFKAIENAVIKGGANTVSTLTFGYAGDDLAAGAQMELDRLSNERARLEQEGKKISDAQKEIETFRKRINDSFNASINSNPSDQPAPTQAAPDLTKKDTAYTNSAEILNKYRDQIDKINDADLTATERAKQLTAAYKERTRALEALNKATSTNNALNHATAPKS